MRSRRAERTGHSLWEIMGRRQQSALANVVGTRRASTPASLIEGGRPPAYGNPSNEIQPVKARPFCSVHVTQKSPVLNRTDIQVRITAA